MEEALNHVDEILRRLHMDLKQLGIAASYQMKYRINLLSQKHDNLNEVKKNYLNYELGDGWYNARMNVTRVIPFIQKLEDQLLNIFDLSHSGQTFITHLSTNVIRVSWFSLVVYLIQCDQLAWSGYFLIFGIIMFIFDQFMLRNN